MISWPDATVVARPADRDGPRLGGQTIACYLDDLAARAPAPGGGAAAALHAAQAAALLSMVAAYTTGSKYVEDAATVMEIAEAAAEAQRTALQLADADVQAFGSVASAYALPSDTAVAKAARRTRIAAALAEAAGPPVEVISLAVTLVDLAERLLPMANRSVVTDVGASSEAARAAATTGRLNVEINLSGLDDERLRARLRAVLSEVDPLLSRIAALERDVRALLRR